jgi:hypothetical protein
MPSLTVHPLYLYHQLKPSLLHTKGRVRVAPSSDATTVGLLAVGDRFKVKQEHDIWAKIYDVENCPLLSGWVLRVVENKVVVGPVSRWCLQCRVTPSV